MDDWRKPYIVAIIVRVIITGMFVINKAAMDHGFNSFVFVFYRQVAASVLMVPIAVLLERRNARSMSSVLLFKIFVCALIGITVSSNLYNVSLKLTSATVVAASTNAIPVITFCLALLLRMEEVKLRSASGMAKLTGVALCLAGVLVIAFYAGELLSAVNHHHAFGAPAPTHAASSTAAAKTMTGAAWIKGTFITVLATLAWSLWLVLQAAVLKEFPNRMLVMATQCLFSVVQSFFAAVVAERDLSMWKLRLDVALLAVLYSGFVVAGVNYYLQAWCMEMRGPVFLAAWTPLSFALTVFCSSFFLGEMVHLGSIVGGILLCGGLYSLLWGKSREAKTVQRNIEASTADGDAQDEVHCWELEGEKENEGREERENGDLRTCVQQD
ncbi:WAT1-related protein At5g64700 isoform X2 [Zea mays]|uniref:WAT1-related protein n=1 Tax=Zea mays TaxID=4577 RepID=A0A804RFP1_MAIZE|nr:WAT1-related protein At5g64700 isoform X2 [Zea mays]|eukprot:XP_008663201.1 WAT1-related protein At5g64700 isoform X2 [Zea mays]